MTRLNSATGWKERDYYIIKQVLTGPWITSKAVTLSPHPSAIEYSSPSLTLKPRVALGDRRLESVGDY